MKTRILVVDDEKTITDLVGIYLRNEGYEVQLAYNGADAAQAILTQEFDLAILDIMLPDIDGFELLRTIRTDYTYPVIMLTARDSQTDKIEGLSLGADDYVVKPFRPLDEYSILLYLAENRGRVVPVEDLFRAVWNEEFMASSNNTVMVHIRHLREKIGDDAQNPRFIKNIWGVGYTIE